MASRHELRIIFAIAVEHKSGDEVLLSTNLIQDCTEMGQFLVVNANEQEAIGTQEIPRKLQARVSVRYDKLVSGRSCEKVTT